MAVVGQKGKGLKTVRGNQVAGERAGVKSRWSPLVPRAPQYLSGWQSRGAIPRVASRGRSRHRFEAPANWLESGDSVSTFWESLGASRQDGGILASPLGAKEHRDEKRLSMKCEPQSVLFLPFSFSLVRHCVVSVPILPLQV